MDREIKLTIRLPSNLHGRLVELAQREHRSLNGEMVALLEQGATQAELRLAHGPPDK